MRSKGQSWLDRIFPVSADMKVHWMKEAMINTLSKRSFIRKRLY